MELAEAAEHGVSQGLLERLHARGITCLTSAQADALRAGLCRGVNIVVCAPTSSGKTTIAELAAVEGARRGDRTVYLVSHRALAEEKFQLFKTEYAPKTSKWFDVSIATGDRTEGEWDSGILIATYEKYLAMVCGSGRVNIAGVVVVADEVQILGDEKRGPEIELLCTLLRTGQPRQIVALSATISNPRDIADWLGCAVVQVTARDVPLHQEVWFQSNSIQCLSGTTEIFPGRRRSPLPADTLEIVDHLLNAHLGPILVFTMTKPRALSLAEEYANRRQRHAEGVVYADQFDLFSEPSTLIRTLTGISQKRVAFHTADLNYAERSLIERGLRERLFDVVFATPTLAAGVNFPFQTVLFDSFYRWFIRGNPWLSLVDYQNMAGRAGRMGLHDKGFAILRAESEVEFDQAKQLIASAVEPLHSKFLSCSLRKVLLAVIAARVVNRRSDLIEFFKNTLWWHQTLDRNPKKLEELPGLIDDALAYLIGASLVAFAGERVFATRLGAAAATTGLLPQTVAELLEQFRGNHEAFTTKDDAWVAATIHAACASPEFGESGQRALPYARNNQPEPNAGHWIRARRLFRDPDSVADADRTANAAYGLSEWIKGTPERALRNMLPPISYGQMQHLGADVASILEGLSRVLSVPEAQSPPIIQNALAELAEALRYGVPRQGLDLIKAGAAYDVPGFGRHRTMILCNAGLSVPNDVLRADKDTLTKLLESRQRAEMLIEALLRYFDAPLEVMNVRHLERAKSTEVEPEIIKQAYELGGEEYEEPIEALLRCVSEWSVTKIDKNKRQGYPDFLVEHHGQSVLVECKTKERGSATLSKDEAFAVLIKGVDFKKDHSVTIGKPNFDEFSKGKANGSTEITLISHQDFIEAILRYAAKKVSGDQLWAWLLTPGHARLDVLNILALPPGG